MDAGAEPGHRRVAGEVPHRTVPADVEHRPVVGRVGVGHRPGTGQVDPLEELPLHRIGQVRAVAARHRRHHGCVGDPQPAHPADPQQRVADRGLVPAHRAAAGRMVQGHHVPAYPGAVLLLVAHRLARVELAAGDAGSAGPART